MGLLWTKKNEKRETEREMVERRRKIWLDSGYVHHFITVTAHQHGLCILTYSDFGQIESCGGNDLKQDRRQLQALFRFFEWWRLSFFYNAVENVLVFGLFFCHSVSSKSLLPWASQSLSELLSLLLTCDSTVSGTRLSDWKVLPLLIAGRNYDCS